MFKFRLRATQFARGLRVWLIPFLRPAGYLAFLFLLLQLLLLHLLASANTEATPKLDC